MSYSNVLSTLKHETREIRIVRYTELPVAFPFVVETRALGKRTWKQVNALCTMEDAMKAATKEYLEPSRIDGDFSGYSYN